MKTFKPFVIAVLIASLTACFGSGGGGSPQNTSASTPAVSAPMPTPAPAVVSVTATPASIAFTPAVVANAFEIRVSGTTLQANGSAVLSINTNIVGWNSSSPQQVFFVPLCASLPLGLELLPCTSLLTGTFIFTVVDSLGAPLATNSVTL